MWQAYFQNLPVDRWSSVNRCKTAVGQKQADIYCSEKQLQIVVHAIQEDLKHSLILPMIGDKLVYPECIRDLTKLFLPATLYHRYIVDHKTVTICETKQIDTIFAARQADNDAHKVIKCTQTSQDYK